MPEEDAMTDTPTLKSQLSHASNPALRRTLTRRLQLSLLSDRIESCRDCSLGDSRNLSVPLDGPTHGRGDLVLVGEAPGFSEDKQGRPFVGKSGMLLSRMLEKAGTERSRVTILNTLCCRPPNNQDPTSDQLDACKPNFKSQLKLSGLWIGVALGGYALANIMGVPRSSVRVGDYLDKPIWVDGRIWWGTYHPAYALRNPMAKRDIILSIKAALAIRWSDDPYLPPFSQGSNQKIRDTETIRALTELNILGDKDIGPHLHKKGWAFGYSEILGEKIVVTGGEDILIKKGIPRALADYPRYSLGELLRIGEAGKGRSGWTKSEMRRLAMVRDEFGGEIVA